MQIFGSEFADLDGNSAEWKKRRPVWREIEAAEEGGEKIVDATMARMQASKRCSGRRDVPTEILEKNMVISPQFGKTLEQAPVSPREATRKIAHDLSNSLEIIMQSSFLLGTLELGENGKAWHKLLEDGIAKATAQNQQLREALRSEG